MTQVREDLRSVDVLVRSPDIDRHAIQALNDLTVTNKQGTAVPLSQVAHLETRMEAAELKRYDRQTYIAVEGDVMDGVQPPDVTAKILPMLATLKASLPAGYRIDTGGSVEEAAKANVALAAVFPIMLVATLTILMIQVRSFSTMLMVFATAPLGLVGAVPTLLLFHQAFGFNAILGLIGLSGILMRNTLILVDQIHHDMADGLSDYDAIIESTVRRARPVILTAVAAMLAFIPLHPFDVLGRARLCPDRRCRGRNASDLVVPACPLRAMVSRETPVRCERGALLGSAAFRGSSWGDGMTADRIAVSHDVPLGARPHLVVKRGHRGRYRFAMTCDGERIAGEVWVDPGRRSADVLHALALARIDWLAKTLQVGLELRASTRQPSGGQADPRGETVDLDDVSARFQTLQRAGDDHGKI